MLSHRLVHVEQSIKNSFALASFTNRYRVVAFGYEGWQINLWANPRIDLFSISAPEQGAG
jgi:hypothetical protein